MKPASIARFLAIAALASSLSAPLLAAEFTKPVQLIIPAPAGGATDVLARLVAPRLGQEIGQPVLVINRPGASGQIAAQVVKAAAPDGATFLVTTEHALAIIPHITPNVGYVAEKDFVPVGKIANLQWALSVPANSGVKTLAEYLERVRKEPLRGNYGVPVMGGIPEEIGIQIGIRGNVQMTLVPFAGGAPVLQALTGSQIDSGITGLPEAVTMRTAGRANILGITGLKRSAYLPGVPTFSELGINGLEADSWFAVFAPKDLPEDLAKKFNVALNLALAEPNVKQKIADMSLEMTPTTLEQARADYSDTVTFWTKRLKDAKKR